jgi:hypothetical protein
LTTMYSVMLPRNPPSESFKQLLDAFRSSQRIHRLIELNLVVGANFTLGWCNIPIFGKEFIKSCT